MNALTISLHYGRVASEQAIEQSIKQDLEELKGLGYNSFKRRATKQQVIIYAKKGVKGYERM